MIELEVSYRSSVTGEVELEILDDGERIGLLIVKPRFNEEELLIESVNVEEGPGFLGLRKVKELRDELKKLFPNAKTITGTRITGMSSSTYRFAERKL